MKKSYIYLLSFILIILFNACDNPSKPEAAYDPEARLEELQITLPEAPQPVAIII